MEVYNLKTKRKAAEVAQGTTGGWRELHSDATAGGKLLQGRSEAQRCPAMPGQIPSRGARRARRRGAPDEQAPAAHLPPVPGQLPPVPGLRPRIRPARSFLPRNPRCSPASPARRGISTGRPQTGTATTARPLQTRQPRGGCSPRTAPAARPALPGSAGPAAAATHPLWRAGWTCTRRRRGWRR